MTNPSITTMAASDAPVEHRRS
ncbi:MAG: hypothetical protein QOI74_4041, partial [Micromonosporaceae bacterium]|nr:hypothetical protein [Micromonosporaceae bacterium]